MANTLIKTKSSLKRYSFLNGLDIDQDVKMRMTQQLDRLVEGSNMVYRSPLLKDKDIPSLLSLFDAKFRDKIRMIDVKELTDLEELNRDKFGPRSIASPWSERQSNLLSYFKENKISDEMLDHLSQAYPKGNRLKPISLYKASSFLKNNTNSGLPFLRPKGDVKTKVLEKFTLLLDRKDPCVLFTRTQEGNKTRNVWGYPIADTLNEMLYYRPTLDYQRKLFWRGALNEPELVNESITNLINSAVLNGYKLISVDFSAYDASVKYDLQKCSFDYIKGLFQEEFSGDIDKLFKRFNTIGVVTPDGVINGSHGVPSGSTFTNEVDSISQYLIARSSNCTIGNLFQIQGDDGAYAIKPENVEYFLNTFKRYGLNVNIDKSYISDKHLIYLQNLYHNDLRRNGKICGIYPLYRAYNRILFQESWDKFEDFGMKGSEYYSLRAISIMENCKYHPLFEEFVKFIAESDKYNLQVSQKGITQYVNYMSSILGTEGIFTNQYGDNIKGIRSFETFKVINKMNSK